MSASDNIEDILEKWDECRRTIETMEKKIKKYRDTVENYMETRNLTVFENAKFKVKKNVQQRSLLTKKMVPKDVWDMYSLPQRVEFLSLIHKKTPSKK